MEKLRWGYITLLTMDEYDYDGNYEGTLFEEIRKIGTHGATIDPTAPIRHSLRSEAAAADEPSLGEDNFDLLQRVRGKTQTRGELPMRESKLQVNLNDEEHLSHLEDADLQEHMNRARKELAEQQKKKPPITSVELRSGDTEARRALSSLMTSLKAQQMALKLACEDIMLQAANAQKLANGTKPYGYPDPEGERPTTHVSNCYNLLSKKIEAAGNEITQISTSLEEFEKNLTTTRRCYEKTVDGLTYRSSWFEDLYSAASELIVSQDLQASQLSKKD